MGMVQQLQKQLYPFLQLCQILMCSNTGLAATCQCFWFLMCSWMLMYVTVHWGCMDTIRECTENSDRKIPCHTGDSYPNQYWTWLFVQTLYQLTHPCHLLRLLNYLEMLSNTLRRQHFHTIQWSDSKWTKINFINWKSMTSSRSQNLFNPNRKVHKN